VAVASPTNEPPKLSANSPEVKVAAALGRVVIVLPMLAAVLSGYDNARLDRALTQAEGHLADSAGAYCG